MIQVQKVLLICIFLSGCSDYSILWEDKPYIVIAVDFYANATLDYEDDGHAIGRVGPRVVAVGSSTDYISVKRCDLDGITSCSYYYIDKKADGLYEDKAVSGPFTWENFNKKSQLLGLPILEEL